jgi:hypothetical protein
VPSSDDHPGCWYRCGADLSCHCRRSCTLPELQGGRGGIWANACQVSIRRTQPTGNAADSEEKREPASDIDTAAVDSLKVLDPKWPIREADIPNIAGVRCGTCYEIAMISSSRPDVPATSPTALPFSDLATGDTKEIEPVLGPLRPLPRYDISARVHRRA